MHDVSYQAGNQIIVSDEETQLVSPNTKDENFTLFHHQNLRRLLHLLARVNQKISLLRHLH